MNQKSSTPLAHHTAAQLLDQALRDALERLRAATPRGVAVARQAFDDSKRGRPIGSMAISRMLIEAPQGGAPLHAALGVAAALEGFVVGLYDEKVPELGAALEAETAAQGLADSVQLAAALHGNRTYVEAAIPATQTVLITVRRLLGALLRRSAQFANSSA